MHRKQPEKNKSLEGGAVEKERRGLVIALQQWKLWNVVHARRRNQTSMKGYSTVSKISLQGN